MLTLCGIVIVVAGFVAGFNPLLVVQCRADVLPGFWSLMRLVKPVAAEIMCDVAHSFG